MAESLTAGRFGLIILVAVVVGVAMALIGNTLGLSTAIIGGVTGGVVAALIPVLFRRRP